MLKSKMGYLHSPGFPGLIELHEVHKNTARASLVTQIHLPIDFKSCGNLKVLGLDRVITRSTVPQISIGKVMVNISDFI
jgi:hypothetical protein